MYIDTTQETTKVRKLYSEQIIKSNEIWFIWIRP